MTGFEKFEKYRQQQEWERARWICQILAYAGQYKQGLKLDNVFPWDKKQRKSITREEMERIKQIAHRAHGKTL